LGGEVSELQHNSDIIVRFLTMSSFINSAAMF
jgi:hypothetical protein